MEDFASSSRKKHALPAILLAAVLQGWALYWLHHAIDHAHWPATDTAWLFGLYALVLFSTVTVQFLASYSGHSGKWLTVVLIAVTFFYFGWHQGSSIVENTSVRFRDPGEVFPFVLVLVVLWLLLLPFVQLYFANGRWTVRYDALFATAWRNKLVLAEAGLFTVLFWLLLTLWQVLFHMLGIDYFKQLFQEPIFVYPVTSLAFGCALHLIGSIERLTAVVLEQILNVLKWLATLAGVILALFTVALLFKLPGLVFTGQRAIGAAWLLWLVAVIVLLINAAFRDGSVRNPYPRWIAQSLRCVVPLTVIVSSTALYALTVRTQQYGLTVDRFWAYVVAGAALVYAGGYSFAAFRSGPWLAEIGRVNVGVALALIAVIGLALTPIFSPYRLAANSQFRMVFDKSLLGIQKGTLSGTPIEYLRFESGKYGRSKLQALATLQQHPDAERIRKAAQAELKRQSRWERVALTDVDELLANLKIYPTSRTLDGHLQARLKGDLEKPGNRFSHRELSHDSTAGVFIDLNDDRIDEFVLLAIDGGFVYENRAGEWVLIGEMDSEQRNTSWSTLAGALGEGTFTASLPKWKELSIGSHAFRVRPQ